MQSFTRILTAVSRKRTNGIESAPNSSARRSQSRLLELLVAPGKTKSSAMHEITYTGPGFSHGSSQDRVISIT